MAVRTTRSPLLSASSSTRLRRSYGYQFGPSGQGDFGFTFNGSGGGVPGGSGGGAPSWLCALLGRNTCSYADVIAAGLGYLLGGGGGGSEPGGNGGGTTPGNLVPDVGPTCPDGTFPVLGRCIDLVPGGGTQGGGIVVNRGEAVMGQFGAALVPESRSTTTLRCPRGMVLGVDELCYNRRDLRKDERKWVPGRKPLLTGGDLNAISRAARAASRVKTTQKRLMKLGLLKRPTPRGGGSRGVITKAEAARALRK